MIVIIEQNPVVQMIGFQAIKTNKESYVDCLCECVCIQQTDCESLGPSVVRRLLHPTPGTDMSTAGSLAPWLSQLPHAHSVGDILNSHTGV